MEWEAKQLFAASEVALHSSRKDCWVVIGGKVSEREIFLVPFSWFTGGDRDLIRVCQTDDFAGLSGWFQDYDLTKFLEDRCAPPCIR